MKKLTPEILRELVDKIVVYYRERISIAGNRCAGLGEDSNKKRRSGELCCCVKWKWVLH